MGMAGTFVAVSRNVDAVGWNPANLALAPTGYQITEQTLEHLKSEGVPDEVLEKLNGLKNQYFAERTSFVDTLRTAIGEEQTVKFQSPILKRTRASEREFCLSPISFGATIANGAFSINTYNKYNGEEWSEQDKQDILNAVPEDGLDLGVDAEVRAFGFSYGPFAFRSTALAAGEAVLPRTPIEIFLFGNEFDRSYRLDDADGEAWAALALSFSGAHAFQVDALKDHFEVLAAGGTLKILRGFVYGNVVNSQGTIYTGREWIDGSGEVVTRYAEGGNGFALDLGLAGTIRGGWTVGLSVMHAFSRISWDKDTEERTNSFEVDPLNVKDISEAEDTEELVKDEELVRDPGTFTSDLPAVLRLGGAREWSKLLWAIDYEQGFSEGAGVSTTPRLSTGLEYRPVSWVTLRGGLSLGGRYPRVNTALGLGLGGRAFTFDLALINRGGVFPGGSKGIGLALDTKIRWGGRL